MLPRLAAFVVLGALPAAALAHSKEPERRLVVQRDARGVALLWQVSLLGGPSELLFATHDGDADGRLSEPEGKRLAAVLLAKASRGVEVRCDGALLPMTSLEARPADDAARRSLVVLALATLAAEGCGGALEVRLAAGVTPLAVEVQTRDGWRLSDPTRGRVAPDGVGLEAAVRLNGGEALRVLAVLEKRP